MWILVLSLVLYTHPPGQMTQTHFDRYSAATFATEADCEREADRIRERAAVSFYDADIPYPAPFELGYPSEHRVPWETRYAFCELARPGV